MPPSVSRMNNITRRGEYKGWLCPAGAGAEAPAFDPGKLIVEKADILIGRTGLRALLRSPAPDDCVLLRVYCPRPGRPDADGAGVYGTNYRIVAAVSAGELIQRFTTLVAEDLQTLVDDDHIKMVQEVRRDANGKEILDSSGSVIPTGVDIPTLVEIPAIEVEENPAVRMLNNLISAHAQLSANIAQQTAAWFVTKPEVLAPAAIAKSLMGWDDKFETMLWGLLAQQHGFEVMNEDFQPNGITSNLSVLA